jgi:hypothetical protein
VDKFSDVGRQRKVTFFFQKLSICVVVVCVVVCVVCVVCVDCILMPPDTVELLELFYNNYTLLCFKKQENSRTATRMSNSQE